MIVLFLGLSLRGAQPAPGSPQGPPTMVNAEQAELEPMHGQVVHFRSGIYDDRQPVAVCTTDVSDKPKPLIVDLIPGTLGSVERAAEACELTCGIAAKAGLDCVAIRPCGRGNGSVYQGYGEVDVYEAIDAVKGMVAIDPDRITVTGASMGGAATWYHVSHHPDRWAAAAPFCGYCDYKLWDKPGGTTFHRQDWEEFSWISRGAAYRVPMLRHVALRIIHGEWDRAVGGGVPVEHSRQMHRKLDEQGIPNTYVELPRTGHGARKPEEWRRTVLWLLEQRRVREPGRVSLVVHTLRHHQAYWVAVEQQERYGEVSTVEARRDGTAINVETENVRRLCLGPLSDARNTSLDLDGVSFSELDLAERQQFVRSTDGWRKAEGEISVGEKRPGLSGPFGDLFFEPTVIVYGTSDSDAETHFNQMMAYNADETFRLFNGGVHRGGIQGDNEVHMPIVSDRDALELLGGRRPPEIKDALVTTELLGRANLLCIGNDRSNAVLAELAHDVGVRVGAASIELGGRHHGGDHVACWAVRPHPDGKRYVAMLAGVDADAICWGSHVGLQLLPDYLVFDHDQVVDWGFWGNDWR